MNIHFKKTHVSHYEISLKTKTVCFILHAISSAFLLVVLSQKMPFLQSYEHEH